MIVMPFSRSHALQLLARKSWCPSPLGRIVSAKYLSSPPRSNGPTKEVPPENDTAATSAQKQVSTSGRFYAEFVKPIEWYDRHALDRQYFYNVDLQGRLFLEETMPKNIATSLKSAKFLDFFFKQLRPNPRDGLFADEYPFISPCGKEMNFVRPFERRSPIVFIELKEVAHDMEAKSARVQSDSTTSQTSNTTTAKDTEHVLFYGATLREVFDPSALVMDTTEGRLFHPLRGHNHLSPALASARRQRKLARRKDVAEPTTDDAHDSAKPLPAPHHTDEEQGEHLALIHSHLASSLSQKFVECDESSSGFAFKWQDQRYPISALTGRN